MADALVIRLLKRLVCWFLGHRRTTVYLRHGSNQAAPLKVCARCARPLEIDLTGCE